MFSVRLILLSKCMKDVGFDAGLNPVDKWSRKPM